MKKRKAPHPLWGVFVAIALAILFGSYFDAESRLFGLSLYSFLDLVGTLFINGLTLVVVPLVSSSIISGLARIGGDASFKRLGGKIFSFYFGTTLLAILIGLFFVNLIAPGHAESIQLPQQTILPFMGDEGHALIKMILSIVPSNILKALSQGEMLALIFFSLLFGYALSRIESEHRQTVTSFFQGIFQTMILFTRILMKFLPYGVFCLVAKVFMTTGLSSLRSATLFALTVLSALASFMGIALPLVLKLIGKVKPKRHFQAMGPALLTAFSTSSSSATLPVTIECVEKRAGVSNKICSLVVPLGTSVNMSGSALYECVAAVFVAQAYGIELSFLSQTLIVLMSLIASMGTAGIPSASLVAVVMILKTVGLPSEGIGLFIAVDRLLDMCRTAVNVFSDSCCAVLVAKSEGEKNVLV